MRPFLWKFALDVGGTFTDVVARRPDGRVFIHKLLSTGRTRGAVESGSAGQTVLDARRVHEPADFWVGYRLTFLGADRDRNDSYRVAGFDAAEGRLVLDAAPPRAWPPGTGYELESNEEAPIVAIRYLMGLRLTDPIPPVDVRLGTTRATNALLERQGAKVALVVTSGFGDVLEIGHQDRPSLFDLNIRKREELTFLAVEVDERMSADGVVIQELSTTNLRRQLAEAVAAGAEAAAICFLHAPVNPAHEESAATIAGEAGFAQVSVSSRVSRREGLVSRGDTTVVDAYLSGVIRSYTASLRRGMPKARIHLMSSGGGLIEADAASGKDTILSGPAGGVVGCARAAEEAGFARAIGFDMGGTSTDVCRVDGPFEHQHETAKAGVRMVIPMLAVETVAAGGGSLCDFDGEKLTVGPRSAGADPGPASYGRGGPLTLTDMNLYLGRLSPDCLPFPLDLDVVRERFSVLTRRVNQATCSELNADEIAQGFVRIANESMASAIRRISTAKGYDPREHVLVSFGGAGGQHACAIARMLEIPCVLHHPFAGVLSAWGIGMAEVRRMAERSVRRPYSPDGWKLFRPIFDSLNEELRRTLIGQGAPPESFRQPVRTVDVCYAGQATFVTVAAAPWEMVGEHFEQLHRQQYGYCHEGRRVEVRLVRVELAVSNEADAGWRAATAPLEEPAPRESDMIVDGQRRTVPVYRRSGLSTRRIIHGPAVVLEDTCTIVLDSGWEGRITERGHLILTDGERNRSHEVLSADRADPIQLELFSRRFAAIAERMGTTLRKTALSTNVKERLDFSCAVFTPEGDLVANAPHIPVHLGGMSDCVKALIEDVGVFAPGDVYLTNDPYRGGSHLNDVTAVTPIHNGADGRLLFFTANRAHHAEIGGKRPGSMPPDSTTLAEEGVLIRATKWVEAGRLRARELRDLLTAPPYPSRSPDENLADFAAQAAANRTGVNDLQALVSQYGIDVVHGYMRHIQAAAERRARRAIAKHPDGVHRFTDRLDDGTPLALTITIRGDEAVFDFTGAGGVHRGNLNANRSIVTSAVLYCLRCLIDEDIPLNSGVLAPVRIILPECLLNPPASFDPADCPAIVGGNVETSQRIVDCVLGALRMAAASQGTMNNLLMGNERFGYYETICGGAGAGPGFHGADAVHTHMTNTRATDPEVLESRYPVRLVRFEIRRGSGGSGRWRGGDGVIRELEFLETLEVSILSQRRTVPPYGLLGGGAGKPGLNLLRRTGSEVYEALPPIVHLRAAPGDRLRIETPGGGGWGEAP